MIRNSFDSRLLVAAPHVVDKEFHRTVVLLLDDDWASPFGVMLNRQDDDVCDEFWQLPHGVAKRDYAVRSGGPLSGSVFALHTCPELSRGQSASGVYMTDIREDLEQILGQDSFEFRLFWGYTSWPPGQLDVEIERGDWVVMTADSSHIFGRVDKLWHQLTYPDM